MPNGAATINLRPLLDFFFSRVKKASKVSSAVLQADGSHAAHARHAAVRQFNRLAQISWVKLARADSGGCGFLVLRIGVRMRGR